MNWAVPASTFPKFVELLSLPSYNYNMLLGLTVSVGGLTESLVSIYTDDMVDSERFFIFNPIFLHSCLFAQLRYSDRLCQARIFCKIWKQHDLVSCQFEVVS